MGDLMSQSKREIAQSPENSFEALWGFAEEYPAEVLANPILPLLLLEHPERIDLLYYARRCLLRKALIAQMSYPMARRMLTPAAHTERRNSYHGRKSADKVRMSGGGRSDVSGSGKAILAHEANFFLELEMGHRTLDDFDDDPSIAQRSRSPEI
jgi:hypothetical protein